MLGKEREDKKGGEGPESGGSGPAGTMSHGKQRGWISANNWTAKQIVRSFHVALDTKQKKRDEDKLNKRKGGKKLWPSPLFFFFNGGAVVVLRKMKRVLALADGDRQFLTHNLKSAVIG